MKYLSKLSLLCFLLLLPGTVSCSNLGSAKGTVIDMFTQMPISGAEIIATITSDIESEQRYINVSAKTDQNGIFNIKGLPEKTYKLKILKDGYTQAESSVQIPKKSTRLIKDPIKIFKYPHERGAYVYSTKEQQYIKLETKPFEKYELSTTHIYYNHDILKEIKKIIPSYLVLYGNEYESIYSIYLLFRHASKINFELDPENSGQYYSSGGTRGFWTMGKYSFVQGNVLQGNELEIVYYERDIKVIDIRKIPNGYYAFGEGTNPYHIKKPTFVFQKG